MAAAEARALWQRAANRCFVQEDAKRAPKLACCQSSSSTSKPVDAEPTPEAGRPVAGFKPLNRTPSHPDLSPDSRWWLQLQPTYGYQKSFTHEQLNALEAEVEMLRACNVNSASKSSKDYVQKKDMTNVGDYTTGLFSAENHNGVGKQGVKTMFNTNTEEHESIHVGDSYEKLDMNSLGLSDSKKASEIGFDPESPWIQEKTDPWWRVTDKNDLASFVAQKSLDHIENCDLPPPQMTSLRRNPYPGYGLQGLNRDEIVASSSDWKVKNGAVFDNTSGRAQGRQWNSFQEHVPFEPSETFRTSNSTNSSIPAQNNIADPESDPSKAELLEALRHSQTRAREAEKAAERAYAEKEDVVKLFFRQASQLFAYKQWFQMLQLETLYLQIKNNNQPMSSLFPGGLPWMPSSSRGKKGRKRGKRNLPRPSNIGNYLVALAVGLGLVGAGLLLGWTVGWLLPF